MAQKKAPTKAMTGRASGLSNSSPQLVKARVKALNAGREQDLTEVDREVIEALTGFRDALRDRAPLERKYTVREVVVVAPPPKLAPDEVKKTREALGVSQPVFAGLLGTSPSTVRSWEQGQKPPSPMARRLLELIRSDPSYWKSRLFSLVQPRKSEHDVSVDAGTASEPLETRPRRVIPPFRVGATATKLGKRKPG
jgi:DNA-binding transcriptional regulator YiaG